MPPRIVACAENEGPWVCCKNSDQAYRNPALNQSSCFVKLLFLIFFGSVQRLNLHSLNCGWHSEAQPHSRIPASHQATVHVIFGGFFLEKYFKKQGDLRTAKCYILHLETSTSFGFQVPPCCHSIPTRDHGPRGTQRRRWSDYSPVRRPEHCIHSNSHQRRPGGLACLCPSRPARPHRLRLRRRLPSRSSSRSPQVS